VLSGLRAPAGRSRLRKAPFGLDSLQQEAVLGLGHRGTHRVGCVRFTEMEEIPRRTKCSAKAGRADGACPQSDELIPASWQAAMTRSIASSTAG
jgi:hypothetical protein